MAKPLVRSIRPWLSVLGSTRVGSHAPNDKSVVQEECCYTGGVVPLSSVHQNYASPRLPAPAHAGAVCHPRRRRLGHRLRHSRGDDAELEQGDQRRFGSSVVTAQELAGLLRQGSLMEALERLRPFMLVSRGTTPRVSVDGSPPAELSLLRAIPASVVREVRLQRSSWAMPSLHLTAT